MRRHTSLPLRSLEENLLGERRNERRENGDCRLGTSAQIAWVLSPRPKTQCGSALSLNPTTVHMGPPESRHITVPGSRRINGWPAPSACSLGPNGRRLEVPNRPAAARPLAPAAPRPAASLSAAPQPRTAAPASGPATYLTPGSPPRAVKRATRPVVRRVSGRALQRFLPGAQFESCSLDKLAYHSTEEGMMVGL